MRLRPLLALCGLLVLGASIAAEEEIPLDVAGAASVALEEGAPAQTVTEIVPEVASPEASVEASEAPSAAIASTALEDSSSSVAATAAAEGTSVAVVRGPSSNRAADAENKRPMPSEVDWWEGEFMGMTSRQVIALSTGRVVLCYGRPQGGGCKAARVAAKGGEHAASLQAAVATAAVEASKEEGMANSQEEGIAVAAQVQNETGLLPPLPWGATQIFHEAATARVELERLTDSSFAICFQRPFPDGTIACSLGLLDLEGSKADAEEGASLKLHPFAAPLELGPGRLVSVVVTGAGHRFAACHRPGHDGDGVACRWAEVHKEESGGGGAVLRWAEEELMRVAVEA